MILLIDNYDSFVYNIAQLLAAIGESIEVRRNDAVSVSDVAALRPAGIVISPGPCGPAEAGVSVPIVRQLTGQVPILGICLGHQVIGHAFGATIRRAVRPMHGKMSSIAHDGAGVFSGISSPLDAVRYHSLAVDRRGLPEVLAVSAVASDGEVMGLRHRHLPVEGIQFHPESIFTSDGLSMLRNFSRACHQHTNGAHTGGALGRR